MKRSFSENTRQNRAQRERDDAGYIPSLGEVRFEDVESHARVQAHDAALELIKVLKRKSVHDPNRPLQVATAESLTAGLIFSTLVDVPFGGDHKYGCFSVYGTDAKRVFLGVCAPDVYTPMCAAQMALGVLRNSNASVAIAVSGNAMPRQGTGASDDELRRLGEVFISVAGYATQADPPHPPAIFVQTRVYNFCEPQYGGSDLANIWLSVVRQETRAAQFLDAVQGGAAFRHSQAPRVTDGFNEFLLTSHISSFIQFQTVRQACADAAEFVDAHDVIRPSFIQKIDSNEERIQTMYYASGQSGVNNIVLGQNRAAALSQLPIFDMTYNIDHDREQEGATRLLEPQRQ